MPRTVTGDVTGFGESRLGLRKGRISMVGPAIRRPSVFRIALTDFADNPLSRKAETRRSAVRTTSSTVLATERSMLALTAIEANRTATPSAIPTTVSPDRRRRAATLRQARD